MGLPAEKIAVETHYDVLNDSAAKTEFIKSFPAIKFLLEKEFAKHGLFSDILHQKLINQYKSTINSFKADLTKRLSEEEFFQLRGITFEVPAGAVLVFIGDSDDFSAPLLAFNIKNMPDLSKKGWLFHATRNLERISKDGLLRSPISSILEKKRYYTDVDSAIGKRITDGISFAFQDYKKYMSYAGNRDNVKKYAGGFFIFMLPSVLKEGLILDFANTVDGYPEVCLRDIQHLAGGDIQAEGNVLAIFMKTINRCQDAIDNFDKELRLFEITRKNMELLQKIVEALEKLKKDQGVAFLNIFRPPAEPKTIVFYTSDMNNPLFSGQSWFYEALAKLPKSLEFYNALYKSIKENNFFEFYAILNFGYDKLSDESSWIPPMISQGKGKVADYLQGTIFNQGDSYIDIYGQGNLMMRNLMVFSVMLTFIKNNMRANQSIKECFDKLKKSSAKEIEKLMRATRAELVDTLEKIIPKHFKTQEDCDVDPRKGILFITDEFNDDETLKMLVNRGVSIFRLPRDASFALKMLFSAVSKLQGLPIQKERADKTNGYFHIKDGKVVFHARNDNTEFLAE